MFRHLIVEYLPHKQQQQCFASTPSPTVKTKASSDGCSVIEMLLGRTPVCGHPASSTLRDTDDGVMAGREPEEELVSSDRGDDQLRSLNIVDRLNEAIRRAQHPDSDRRRRSGGQHCIAVQA